MKSCPCGEALSNIVICGGASDYAYVTSGCCGEWYVKFNTNGHPTYSEECEDLAKEAWNAAPRRATDPQPQRSISDAEIEQVAADESQQDWGRLAYARIYREAFVDGAQWMRERGLPRPD